MKIKTSISLLFLLIFFCSCDFVNEQTEHFSSADPAELIRTEEQFSRMSKERGMKQAFLHYIAKDGILLRPDEDPIVGADAIEFLSMVNDEGYHITWNPSKAEISRDGNMGFTYGVYTIEVNDNVIHGTYVNVWKKQNGEWRFLLNSGNQGVANE